MIGIIVAQVILALNVIGGVIGTAKQKTEGARAASGIGALLSFAALLLIGAGI